MHAPNPVVAAAPRRRASVDKATANRPSTNNVGGGAPASCRGGPPNKRERQVGQFVLSKTMGEGTFGEVRLAVHKPTSERVAAKVIMLCGDNGDVRLWLTGEMYVPGECTLVEHVHFRR